MKRSTAGFERERPSRVAITRATADGQDAMATPMSLDIARGLEGCEAAIWIAEVEPAQVAPHLPEGFTPQSFAQGVLGLPANPSGSASFGAEALVCASGTGVDGETVEPIVYGSLFAFVEPPAEFVGRR